MDDSNIRKEGIPLKEINFTFLLLAILISCVLGWSMYRTSKLYADSSEATAKLVSLREGSYGLQVASDYLTDQMRLFAVTGNTEYLDNYFEEAFVTRRREKAVETLEREGENSQIIQNITNALAESKELMELEYYAARLTYEGYGYPIEEAPEDVRKVQLLPEDLALSKTEQKNKAAGILFDEDYLTKKDAIKAYILECLNGLEEELHEKQTEADKEFDKQVWGEHILTVVLILIMLGIVILTYWLIIEPLQKCVEYIRGEKNIPLKGAYEIQFLAKTYNLMYHMNLISREQMIKNEVCDELTGLYNKDGYDFLIRNADLATSSLVLMEINSFKEYEEEHGRESGNKVVQRTADLLCRNFRSGDYICRLDDGLFAIIMTHADISLESKIKEKVTNLDKLLNKEQKGTTNLTASAGIAFGNTGDTTEEIYQKAADALEKSKSRGKGESVVYKYII